MPCMPWTHDEPSCRDTIMRMVMHTPSEELQPEENNLKLTWRADHNAAASHRPYHELLLS